MDAPHLLTFQASSNYLGNVFDISGKRLSLFMRGQVSPEFSKEPCTIFLTNKESTMSNRGS